MLNDAQKETLKKSEQNALSKAPEKIESIAEQTDAGNLSDEELLAFLQICNTLYRRG